MRISAFTGARSSRRRAANGISTCGTPSARPRRHGQAATIKHESSGSQDTLRGQASAAKPPTDAGADYRAGERAPS
eukprot:SAG31_NODE_5661_length_2398_cov_2.414093_2_plen_76_part_00